MINSAKEASILIKNVFYNVNIQTVYHEAHFNPNGNHVRLRNVKSGTIYHIKYATEPFMSFGKIFRQHDGKIGETIDQEAIKDLKNTDVLMFSYPEYIYEIGVKEFREQGLSRLNDRDGSMTLSVPISSLKRFI